MKVIADTHLHVYPFYDVAAAMANLAGNLSQLVPGAVNVACLAERSGCSWFAQLESGGESFVPGFRAENCGEERAMVLHGEGGEDVYVLPGRQIVTRERVEILCLTADLQIPDGLPGRKTVEDVLSGDGIPVLSWAPGKWFFGRGVVVAGLIEEFGSKIGVGDTSLRSTLWPEPKLMERAAANGVAVIAGSDPLPFAGEEKYFGTYASAMECEFDSGRPVSSIRTALTSAVAQTARQGRRCGPLETLQRIRKNARTGR